MNILKYLLTYCSGSFSVDAWLGTDCSTRMLWILGAGSQCGIQKTEPGVLALYLEFRVGSTTKLSRKPPIINMHTIF